MGIETALLVGAVVATAATVVSTVGEVEAIKAEQDASYLQETELNKIAAAEAGDATRRADKRAADAIAAMESLGGFGSYNDTRLQMEMAGLKGLDLARIESNRARQAAQLYQARRALGKQASGAVIKGVGSIASTWAGFGVNSASAASGLDATRNLAKT